MDNLKHVSMIVGAGVIKNAWLPVIRALQPFHQCKLDVDMANNSFAMLVYQLRFFASSKIDPSKKGLSKCLEDMKIIKNEICQKISESQASGELTLRDEFHGIAEKFLFSNSNKLMLVSTNWDTVFDEGINKIGQSNHLLEGSSIIVHHIHGSVYSSSCIYLPTEVTREQYRTPEEDQEMGIAHGNIRKALEKSNICTVYGLSLSPLDAELCYTLLVGWDNENLQTVNIVDPEHSRISRRVRLLLESTRDRRVQIYGYDPSNLANRIDYTDVCT